MSYQLVLQLPISEETDFDLLLDLEGRLEIGLGDGHDVDSHAFGLGEMNIFIHTSNPNEAFLEIRQLIEFVDFPEIQVAYRGEDKHEFTHLWPEGSSGSFSVT